jgi:hypothetical protein
MQEARVGPLVAHTRKENTMSQVSTAASKDTARTIFRAGYAANGLVYLLIGGLALDAAFSSGESAEGAKGAITQFSSGTLGTVLLTILAIGLLAYAAMRFWEGVANPAHYGNDAKGIGKRIGRIAGALSQTVLALYALSIAYAWFDGLSAAGGSSGSASGSGGSSSGGSTSGGVADVTAKVMQWPAGQWIMGIVGVGIVVAGIAQLSKAVKASFMDELESPEKEKTWIKPLGRAGFGARFVVFSIVGVLIVIAAIQAKPDQAVGLGGALRKLQEQPFGPWLLGVVALGLIAFAFTRGVYARYAIFPGQIQAK